jgi:hypothetical protein
MKVEIDQTLINLVLYILELVKDDNNYKDLNINMLITQIKNEIKWKS